MRWGGGHWDEDKLLASCYRNAMRVAQERAFHSIAFPAIERVVFCCVDDAMASCYRQAIPTLRHLGSN